MRAAHLPHLAQALNATRLAKTASSRNLLGNYGIRLVRVFACERGGAVFTSMHGGLLCVVADVSYVETY